MTAYRTADATVSTFSVTAVTPSDSTIIPTTRALYVGTGGNVAVMPSYNSAAVTFLNVASGTILPVQVNQVMVTNTTASGILALY